MKLTGYGRKTDSGYDSWDDANANADNILYAFQGSLESKKNNIEDRFTYTYMFMIDTMIQQ